MSHFSIQSMDYFTCFFESLFLYLIYRISLRRYFWWWNKSPIIGFIKFFSENNLILFLFLLALLKVFIYQQWRCLGLNLRLFEWERGRPLLIIISMLWLYYLIFLQHFTYLIPRKCRKSMIKKCLLLGSIYSTLVIESLRNWGKRRISSTLIILIFILRRLLILLFILKRRLFFVQMWSRIIRFSTLLNGASMLEQ